MSRTKVLMSATETQFCITLDHSARANPRPSPNLYPDLA